VPAGQQCRVAPCPGLPQGPLGRDRVDRRADDVRFDDNVVALDEARQSPRRERRVRVVGLVKEEHAVRLAARAARALGAGAAGEQPLARQQPLRDDRGDQRSERHRAR